MREILELCIDLDSFAETTYREFAATCDDEQLARTFAVMSQEEGVHVGWWKDLLTAWEAGLVPDIVDEADPLARLREVGDDLAMVLPADAATLGAEDMLSLAAHLEFHLLDPVFGELINITGPGGSVSHNESYRRHVMRVVEAIESRYEAGDLARFLARMLRRSFRDQQRLAQLATRDPLTGLLNRRGLYATAMQWSAWSARYGHPLSCVVVDVDRFKSINDAYGHPTGDMALVQIANALTRAVRSSDIVGRYGGDEFLVIAPETDSEELRALMERILESVRVAGFRTDDQTIAVSVSAGGSWTDGGISLSADRLLAAADRSLYSAKAEGRDRAGEPVHAASEI